MDPKELLEKIYDKLEKLNDHFAELNVIVAKQEVNLQNHMKRSDTLELQVNLLKEQYEKDYIALKEDLEPVQTHVKQLKGLMKLTSLIFAGCGAVYSIIKGAAIISQYYH